SQRYALEDYSQTAEQLSVTILTMSEKMRVLHKSGAFNTIFGRDCEFGIDPHNRFYMNDAEQNDKLKRHVEHVARTVCHSLDQSRHVLMLPSETANGWWSVLCKRMHEDVFAGGELGPCVKLYIRFVPSLLQITPDLICSAMGLTPRQAEVAAGIVNGTDLETIAGNMGISRNTVRVHVAAIYARTAVRSRSEFTFLALRRLNNGWC
ncbi:MAG: helix-turn-helix transcriptional regulator, partial [Sphingobacteriales bacterium]